MKTRNKKQKDKRFSLFLSAVNQEIISPDGDLLNELQEKTATRFLASSVKSKTQMTTITLIWRKIMESKVTKPAAAVLVVAVGVLIGTIFLSAPGSAHAYTLQQTVEALGAVRHIHTVMYDKEGNIEVARWIEISPSGHQSKYWQDTPNILICDDGETSSVFYKDENTVVLYNSTEKRFQWFGNLRHLMQDLAGHGKRGTVEIKPDILYRDQPAHKVRLVKANLDCYIDPQTKLPIAIGPDEISYDEPAVGTFAFLIPEGAQVVDKRTSAKPVEEPDWMKKEEIADRDFSKAIDLLAEGDYIQATELLTNVVEIQPRRNWAWFWLGHAHYKLGQYDTAIYEFTKVINMFRFFSKPLYCYYTRGLAYAEKGMGTVAEEDLMVALPEMIKGLRNQKAAYMFDYADDPIFKKRSDREQELIKQVIVLNMISRLRKITSQNFGADLTGTNDVSEEVIIKWENWYKTSPAIQVDHDYKPHFVILEVPATEKEFKNRILSIRRNATAEQALELFVEAKNLQPPDNSIWYLLAFSLYDTGCYSESLEAFGRVVELKEKQDLEYIYGPLTWQGHILDLLGRRNEAISHYQKALQRYTGSYCQYGQYGVKVDKKWIKQRLKEPFQRK